MANYAAPTHVDLDVACERLAARFQREGLLRGNWRTHLGVRDSVMMEKLRD